MSSEWERGYAAGYHAAARSADDRGFVAGLDAADIPKKKKRKASAYSKRYGAAYKRLKRKHPRMSFGAISKKAHKEARRK